jgi:peroxiredoxin
MKLRSLPVASVLALLLIALPGAVSALEVGDKAPDFELASTKGGKLQLSSLAGKQNVVIQFYVLDYSPG